MTATMTLRIGALSAAFLLFGHVAAASAQGTANPGPDCAACRPAAEEAADMAPRSRAVERFPAVRLALPFRLGVSPAGPDGGGVPVAETLIFSGPVEKIFFAGDGDAAGGTILSLGAFTSSPCALAWAGCGGQRFGMDASLDFGGVRLTAGVLSGGSDDPLSGDEAALRLEGAYIISRGGRAVAVPLLRYDQYGASNAEPPREEVTLNLAFFPWDNVRLRAEWWNAMGQADAEQRRERFSILFDLNF